MKIRYYKEELSVSLAVLFLCNVNRDKVLLEKQQLLLVVYTLLVYDVLKANKVNVFSRLVLQVQFDVRDDGEWKDCMRISGVKLPTNYFFGFSAATGDLAGLFDYFIPLKYLT